MYSEIPFIRHIVEWGVPVIDSGDRPNGELRAVLLMWQVMKKLITNKSSI